MVSPQLNAERKGNEIVHFQPLSMDGAFLTDLWAPHHEPSGGRFATGFTNLRAAGFLRASLAGIPRIQLPCFLPDRAHDCEKKNFAGSEEWLHLQPVGFLAQLVRALP